MDGHQLALLAAARPLCTLSARSRAPLHHGAGLGAGRGDRPHTGGGCRPPPAPARPPPGGRQTSTACLQYRAPIGQAVAELIKSYAAGGPRGHDNGSYSYSPFCGIQLRPLTLRYILIIIQGQLEKNPLKSRGFFGESSEGALSPYSTFIRAGTEPPLTELPAPSIIVYEITSHRKWRLLPMARG